MNYQKIYNQLVSKRQQEIPEGYTENHHIIPKCLGGTNDPDNFIKLTAREHFIAHQLLVKICNNYKLIHAANCMANTNGFRINGKKYQWIKLKWIKEANHSHSEETKQKISKSNKGKIQTEEHKKKNSDANKGERNAMYGKTHTPEVRALISKAHTGRKHPEEFGLKISERLKNVPKTEEHNKKNSEATKKRWDNMSPEQRQAIKDKANETRKRKKEEANEQC